MRRITQIMAVMHQSLGEGWIITTEEFVNDAQLKEKLNENSKGEDNARSG